MDFRGMSATHYDDDASSSRDSSLARSEPDQQAGGSRKSAKNLDRRRESSRYAARDRRGKEADIFLDLKDVVPIVDESTVTHVDRIALLRVASTMCRMRRNAGKFLETDLPAEDPETNVFVEQNLTECLDGFVLLADSDGTILYVSESVSLFLGLTQTDLVGRFLNEFVHNDDYDELIRWSTTDCDVEEASTLDDFGRYLVVRMKTVISPRGRTLNLKSALYKAIITRFRAVTTEYGRLSLIYGSSTPAGQGNSMLLANSAVKGSETTSGVYMTRHTTDMRFSYVSDSLNYLLRHDSRSLMGTSFYDLVHPGDIGSVAQSFTELFKKGHCRTGFYRLLGANSSVAWVQSEATTVNHTARGQKGVYVLCVHSIVGMQSETESWAEPIVDSLTAANPAICASRIKREIIDMADYMGRQPEFVECVDFTPLIDPVSDVNFNDFNPVRSANGRGRNGANARRQADSNNMETTIGKQKRKNSFENVLQWLTRDQVDSPPPNYSEDMFADNSDPSLAQFNANTRGSPNENDQSFRGNFARGRVVNTTPIQPQQQQFFNQQQWQPNGRVEMQLGQATTVAMAGRPNVGSGTASNLPNRQYQRGGFVVGGTDVENDGERKEVFESGQQRFSRFDTYRQKQRQQQTGHATLVNTQRNEANGKISSFSRAAGNTMSNVEQRINGNNNAALYSAMRASNIATKNQRAGCAAIDNSADDTPQFVGEFYKRNSSNNRSRSSSSTASYGQSAARRYSAQNSPAPTRRPDSRRSVTKSGIQRPVNVNQLDSVPPQLQQYQYNNQFNGSPTSGPNFYYSARNTQNPSFYQQQTRSLERSNNYNQPDVYATIPAKRPAYGCEEPFIDCQQTDQFPCEDLSNLAPFVADNDMLQLDEVNWESFCPDFDLSEFFPNEKPSNPPPAMNMQQRNGMSMECNQQINNQNQQYAGLMVGSDPALNEDWGFGQY